MKSYYEFSKTKLIWLIVGLLFIGIFLGYVMRSCAVAPVQQGGGPVDGVSFVLLIQEEPGLTTLEQIYQDLIITIFGQYQLWHILLLPLLTGIVSSFMIEGLNTITSPTIKGKLLMLVVCSLVGVLLWFLFPMLIPDVAFKILMLALNITVALLFYHTIGKRAVEFLIGRFLKKVGLDKNES